MIKAFRSTRGMIVEKDVEIPMRGGVRLNADVFRPHRGGKDSIPL